MKKVRDFSLEGQYNLVLPSLTKYRKRYALLNYDKNLFDDAVAKMIKSTAETYEDSISNYPKFFEKKLKEVLEELIRVQAQENKLQLVSGFISECVYVESDFKKLSDFLKLYKIDFTLDDCIELFDIQKNLDFMIPKILKRDKNRIIEFGLEEVYTNDILSLFVEAYAIKRGISLEQDEETFDNEHITSTSEISKEYLDRINKIPLLTPEEEKVIATQAMNGDEEARNKLVTHNLKWAAKMSGRYVGRGLDYMDIIQEANMGLMKAAEKFDVTKNYRFTTYASWWIRQSIIRGISDKSRNRRLPVHVEEDVKKFSYIRNKLCAQLDRKPTLQEIADAMNIDVEKAEKLELYCLEDVSLNMLVGEEEKNELSDFIPDTGETIENQYEKTTLISHIEDLLKKVKLSENERKVIILRYGLYDGEPKTLDAVGKIMGVTRERIRQHEAKALQRLRNSHKIKELLPFMNDPNLCEGNLELFRKYYRNPSSKSKDPSVLLEDGTLQKMFEEKKEEPMVQPTTIFTENNNGITEEEYIELITLINSEEYLIAFEETTERERKIMCLAFGFVKNIYFNPEEVANIVHLPKKEVLETLRINVPKYKEQILRLKLALYPEDLSIKRALKIRD